MTVAPNIIEAHRLCFAYQKTKPNWVLDKIDLLLGQGEYVLICGASGSGKSTLARTFNGLIPNFHPGRMEGTLKAVGVVTTKTTVADLFAVVGMVFQNPQAQLFNRTVKREIAFGLESLGMTRQNIKRRIKEVTAHLGIESLLDSDPQKLSGGEQQLVAIAAIAALNPKLIVLDEPYANLDPLNVRRVRQMLTRVNGQGIAIVVCEHRLAKTVPDVERIVVLQNGRVVADGPPSKVLSVDLEALGLEPPPAVKVSHLLNIIPPRLQVAALDLTVSELSLAKSVRPAPPAPVADDAGLKVKVKGLYANPQNGCTLSDINFRVCAGESLAIVGKNGAGKTTLAKHLNGLLRPLKGDIRIDGLNTRNQSVSKMARQVGIVFQNPNDQFFKLTVREEIEVGPRALDCFDADWLAKLADWFKLKPLLDRAPYRLSGGEKKRVAFAAALAAKPAVLVLDEPTAGQDGYFRQALGGLLSRLRSQGRAVVMITHDLNFAQQHAHRFLVMAGGRVLSCGAPEKIMADQTVMAAAGLEPTEWFKLFQSASQLKGA